MSTVTSERLGLIVAVGPHRIIGRARALPWRIPEDVAFVRATTSGHSLVVGRTTFEEIGQLDGRRLIVVTSRRASVPRVAGVQTAPNADEAVVIARQTDPMPIVIGGATVYAALLSLTSGGLMCPCPGWNPERATS